MRLRPLAAKNGFFPQTGSFLKLTFRMGTKSRGPRPWTTALRVDNRLLRRNRGLAESTRTLLRR
jgi:hypothetical protein